MSDIHHYGVHWAPGQIAFLHQTRGGSNAVGLREPSPFKLRGPVKTKPCNHVINLASSIPPHEHMEIFRELVQEDDLVRWMLPIPEPGVRVLRHRNRDEDVLRLTLLLKMTSFVRVPMRWSGFQTRKAVTDELQMTNVQPFVLLGVNSQMTAMAEAMGRDATLSPRKLLLVTDGDVPLPFEELSGYDFYRRELADMLALSWENFGATVLRAHMRREWSNNWLTRTPSTRTQAA